MFPSLHLDLDLWLLVQGFLALANSYNLQLVNHAIGEIDLGVDVLGDAN